jgi:hypothetical protein
MDRMYSTQEKDKNTYKMLVSKPYEVKLGNLVVKYNLNEEVDRLVQNFSPVVKSEYLLICSPGPVLWLQPTISHSAYLNSVWIIFFNIFLGLKSEPFPSGL